jgi:pathogenesis-related protein 1
VSTRSLNFAEVVFTVLCISACVQNTSSARVTSTDVAHEVALPPDPAAFLTAHNQWRAQVGVPSLQWSANLAGRAQQWADHLAASGCASRHSGNMQYGENIFFVSPVRWSNGSAELQQVTPQQVVDDWGRESEAYDYASNSCSNICGHYTQLVWRDSKEVGCGHAACLDKGQIWVCNYYPAGNVDGEKPY